MSDCKLFLYGSFDIGMPNFKRISKLVKEQLKAFVNGTAYRTEVGYPALSLEGTHQIHGTVATFDSSPVLLQILDEFHGFSPIQLEKSLHHRKSVIANAADGTEIEAIVYEINPKKILKSYSVIEGGDWRGELERSPSVMDQLTENEVSYVLKLGAAVGRDIVPIDLGLYRKMMGSGLIVDKGRRLALTKLGKEIYRHLS